MSKLDELIQQLCPDGVKYKSVQETAEVGTGRSNGNEAVEDGEYPFFIRSQTIQRKNDYEYDEEAIIIPGEGGIGDIYHYVNGKYALHQRVYRIHFTDPQINTKFAYYYFQSSFKRFILKKAVSATVTSIRKPMITGFEIPVPPLPVQEEIVRILDNFTELTAELTVELTARKKQYEYYRDSILTNENKYPVTKLGDICSFVRGPFGGALKKEIFASKGFAVYEQQHAIYRNLEFRYYIDRAKFEELRRFEVQQGDMIVSCSGTIGKTFIIPQDAPKGIINQALLKLTPHKELNVFYMQYFFENTISKILNEVARGGAIKNVPSVSELKKIEIPVPPLSEQERIVAILDRFDTLCNDLTSGLPAEIEARQKQYEYYRDKLLSLKGKKYE